MAFDALTLSVLTDEFKKTILGGKINKIYQPEKDEIVLSLTGDVLEGSFPGKQLKLLLAWTALHEDELEANWKLLSDGEGYFKIEPLK